MRQRPRQRASAAHTRAGPSDSAMAEEGVPPTEAITAATAEDAAAEPAAAADSSTGPVSSAAAGTSHLSRATTYRGARATAMEELDASRFEELGDFAAAGAKATELALARCAASSAEQRIPISGAIVTRAADGALTTIAVGCNGRIPADEGPGYPTDHGETGCMRLVGDMTGVDWKNAVFATSLSPCIMCTRTMLHLQTRHGLSRVVIAESETFGGRSDLLIEAGMTVVQMTCSSGVEGMMRFARRYPVRCCLSFVHAFSQLDSVSGGFSFTLSVAVSAVGLGGGYRGGSTVPAMRNVWFGSGG